MLKSIYYLPHGMQIIPDLEKPYNEEFRPLHEGMMNISDRISLEEPQNIVLITPHGYNLDEDFLIYLHSDFQGFLYHVDTDSVVFGDIHSSHQIDGNLEGATALYQHLSTNNLPIKPLIQGYSEYPLTLNWGEMVPIHYLNHKFSPSYIIISIPRLRHTDLSSLRSELNNLGKLLIQFFSSQKQSYSFVISGDLSHVHQEDGPYGYHESCKKFDSVFNQWVKKLDDISVEQLFELQSKALACGISGVDILQSIFEEIDVELKYSSYAVPTYYGMGIAHWKVQ